MSYIKKVKKLSTSKNDFYEFLHVRLSWTLYQTYADLKIDFKSKDNTGGGITEIFLCLKAFSEEACEYNIDLCSFFLVYSDSTIAEKLKAPTHVRFMVYSEFLSFMLDHRRIQGIRSGDDDYLEIFGVELRFENSTLRSDFPFPTKEGCELLVEHIEKVYNV